MRTATIKLDDKLEKKIATVGINWSEYIRCSIAERIEPEERKKAAAKLLESLQRGQSRVRKGFVNKTIRETTRTS
jgi:predicted DNA-binding protein